MAVAGLSVTSIEMKSTQNFVARKTAFYKAVEGTELIRQMISENSDAEFVGTISKSRTETYESNGTESFEYITGTLKDFEEDKTVTVQPFTGFDAPPITRYIFR